LKQPKDSSIAQFRKLVLFHDPDLVFTDAAIKEVARIASAQGTRAKGLRSVIEEVLEGVLFDVEAGVRYLITEKTVRGGEAVRQRVEQSRAPLAEHLM
jgi:ATP-dependent Clp protease ATP-binding subunit ClpX